MDFVFGSKNNSVGSYPGFLCISTLLVKLGAFDRNHGMVPEDQKECMIQRRAIPTLSKLSKFAKDYGIQLLLEPLNRYSTPYCKLQPMQFLLLTN